LDLDGAVVTSGALHTVRANLEWLVREKKAHYIAVVKRNQPLLHARVRALPWRQVPAGSATRERGHGRAETRTPETAHVSGLDFPGARQAIKITRWRQDTVTGTASRQTAYAVTSMTSAHATAQDLARLVREQWSIEALGGQAWHDSGLGGPADIDALAQKITHLEQQAADLRLQLEERDQDLATARAANRELMAQLNHPTRR
jgi:hypothetical protein